VLPLGTEGENGLVGTIRKLSSPGALDVTNLADGIARFLIERGKQELNAAFFHRLEKFLDSTEECRILFPKSIEVFKTTDPYQYAEYIKQLREAFHTDLSNLIISLNQLIESPKYQRLLKELPEIRLAIRSSKIVQELSQSGGAVLPDSVISQLAALNEWGEMDVNLGNSWKLLNVISQSVRYDPHNRVWNDSISSYKTTNEILVRDKIDSIITVSRAGNKTIRDTSITIRINGDTLVQEKTVRDDAAGDSVVRRWIRLSDLNALIKDTTTLKIFLGLFYETTDGIYFKIKNGSAADTISVQSFMYSQSKNILSISGLIENFVTLANDVDRTIEDFRDKRRAGLLSNEDYYSYINKAINLTEYGFKVANAIYQFRIKKQDKPDLLDNRYISIARNGNELYKNIYSKNYNGAVTNVYNILELTFSHKNELIEERLENQNVRKHIEGRTETIDSAAVETVVKGTPFPSMKILGAFLKYGNFMASVVKAESGEEVQKAIEAAALPAGSYSIKQKSEVNISVNGYIGYAWDFGKVSLKDPYAKGVYAPVGVNLTHGSAKNHGLSFTGFVSLIDVGSVAAYRLQSGTTETLKQEVRLESIFSPSAQLIVELGGYPFAIAGGWRRTPKLFYSGNSSFTTVLPRNVFNFSVMIDVPVFTIYNRQFQKK